LGGGETGYPVPVKEQIGRGSGGKVGRRRWGKKKRGKTSPNGTQVVKWGKRWGGQVGNRRVSTPHNKKWDPPDNGRTPDTHKTVSMGSNKGEKGKENTTQKTVWGKKFKNQWEKKIWVGSKRNSTQHT